MEHNSKSLTPVFSLEDAHPFVPVTDTLQGLDEAIELLKSGDGPIAMDAERASGFRYSQRPYLIQLFRRGAGVVLLDPPALGDLSILTEEFSHLEWILHAATQDLPNLREHGMEPKTLFDTELAARLLGIERFGLAALLEQFLDIHLAKKFSAVDWSTRPLPEEWLIYAALDVEYLVDLAEILQSRLIQQNRADIAQAEFASLLTRPIKQPPAEPWRKLSGIHQLKTPDQLAIARQLWLARDELAQQSDTAPGRLIPDRAIIAVASKQPASFPDLMHLKEFTGKASRTESRRWWAALQAAQKVPDKPELKSRIQEIPPVKAWERNFPDAKKRYDQARQTIMDLATELEIPHDLLLTPEYLRIVSFEPPIPLSLANISESLSELGARDWQISYSAPIIYKAFVESLQN